MSASLGLECVHCGELFALFGVQPDVKKIEEQPDPFRAKCPYCEIETSYPRGAIRFLVVGDDQ
jgi:hypothetical protein